MSDEVIVCVECGRAFTWAYGEQRYYKERGLDRPKRCAACRSKRKAEAWPESRGGNFPSGDVLGSFASRPEVREASHAGRPRGVVGPVLLFGAVTFATAVALALALALGFALDWLLSWLIGITIVTMISYGYDKAIARTEHMRVPEKVLLVLALAGGTVGAFLGMRLFHHKTAKTPFQFKFWIVVAVQAVLVVVYYAFIRG